MVKLGINIHPVIPIAPKNPKDRWTDSRLPSAQEKLDLDRFLIESDADANLVMNDIDNARRIAALVPRSKTIFRLYNKDVEGELWSAHTPASYVEGMKGYYDERLILNIGNEPDGKMPLENLKRGVDFYCGVMRLMGEAGQRVTLPAWGSGNPSLMWFEDDTFWQVLKPLFEAFRQYPTNTLNLHTYFNKTGLNVGNGHLDRPEAIAKLLTARGVPVPDMFITEYGADNVADTPGPWQQVFGADDLGETRYAELLTLGLIKALHQKYIKGIMAYCWFAYPEWRLYDISKARIVQRQIIIFNAGQTLKPPAVDEPETPPPVTPNRPSVPVPSNLSQPHPVEIRSRNGYHLQAEPLTNIAKKVGMILDGELVTLYRSTQTFAEGLIWYWCERTSTPAGESNVGWIVYSLPPVANEPPAIPALPEYGSPEWRKAVSSALRTLADLIDPIAA